MQEDEVIYEVSKVVEDATIVEESGTEVVDVEIFEAFQAPTAGDSFNHAMLTNREIHDAHPITAITGLRDELDSIEALQTIYSDKSNVATYYKWKDAAYDEYGYFVSMIPDTSEIKVCDGSDIFGVSIETAGFVGGEDAEVPRDNTYGLIATSGLVDVRCELDVDVGDYVVSNRRGWATKSGSNYGYKVLAIKDFDDGYYDRHAVISLDMQADRTNALGENLQRVEAQVEANYKNIVGAINVANQAYNKSNEATTISQEALKDALAALAKSDDSAGIVQDALNASQSASGVAAQAKAIAEGAVTSADTLKNEAVARANDAWAKADEVQKEAYSLCAKIDQYSVGEYSQAYGLTVEQAQSILKLGMIYAPTANHSETYTYSNQDLGTTSYTRNFTAEYLYMWGYLTAMGINGWITVDKFYNKIEDDKLNDSNKAVYFFKKPIDVSEYDNFGYWYTDSDAPEDSGGNVGIYEPYTLYKWEDGHWIAVATLKGNVSNRMVSEVYQTTNEIMMGVFNPRGGVAAFDAKLTNTEAITRQLAAWKNGKDESKAIIYQEADDDGARIVISTVTTDGEKDSEARLVLSANKDGDALCIDASQIMLNGETTFTTPDPVDGTTKIDGGNIATGTIKADQIDANAITADKIATDAITSRNYYTKDVNGNYTTTKSGNGMKLDLSDGSWDSKNFKISSSGEVTAKAGEIAGWNIDETKISKGDVLLNTDDSMTYKSLVTDDESPVRFATSAIDSPIYEYITKQTYVGNGSSGLRGVINTITVSCDGELLSVELIGAKLEDDGGGITAVNNCYIQNINPTTNTFEIVVPSYDSYDFGYYTLQVDYRYQYKQLVSMKKERKFQVLDDGSLYASAAQISGGTIAGLKIEENRLMSTDSTDDSALVVDNSGVQITGPRAKIRVGDGVSLSHIKDASGLDEVELWAGSHFVIRGESGASLDVMRSVATEYGYIKVEMYINDSNMVDFSIRLEAGKKPTSITTGTIPYTITYTNDGSKVRGNLNYTVHSNGEWEIKPKEILEHYGTSCRVDVVTLNGVDYKYEPTSGYAEILSESVGQYPTTTNTDWYMKGSLIPENSITKNIFYNLGTDANGESGKWHYVYTNNALNGSDRKIKDNILSIPMDFSAQLINGLVPKSYTLKSSKTPRTHYGFIAQEVEELLYSLGTSPDEVGIVCKSKPGEPDSEDNHYSLNYTNLIAPMVSVIQQLSKRVEELENKLNTIQND